MNDQQEKITTFLALDSASRRSSVALQRGERREVVLAGRDGAPEDLLSAVDHCLRRAEVSPRELDGILCTSGPGSFTGIRIGLASAMGLAESLDLPATAVTRHLAQAWWVTHFEDNRSPVLSVLPSHGGRWSVQAFRVHEGVVRADGPIHTRNTLAGMELPIVSSPALEEGDAPSGPRFACPPLAEVLCDMAMETPPGAPGRAAPESGPLRWDRALLRQPVYGHSPAVAFRPRPTGNLGSSRTRR